MHEVREAIRTAIAAALADAVIEVAGGDGHYNIVVRSAAFAGKSTLDRHRLVMAALATLMADSADGAAPVHAVDSLKTIPL